jgi:hypothetical protein
MIPIQQISTLKKLMQVQNKLLNERKLAVYHEMEGKKNIARLRKKNRKTYLLKHNIPPKRVVGSFPF